MKKTLCSPKNLKLVNDKLQKIKEIWMKNNNNLFNTKLGVFFSFSEFTISAPNSKINTISKNKMNKL
jgi:hypothetical protein